MLAVKIVLGVNVIKKSINLLMIVMFILSSLFGLCQKPLQAMAATTPNIYGDKAQGVIPPSLPRQFMLGLGRDETSLDDDSVPWNMRYCYLVDGWQNWNKNSEYPTYFMNDCDKVNAIPAFQYYVLKGKNGGSEEDFYKKTKNSRIMEEYFNNFKLFMQKVKEFKKPVVVMIEADGFAYLQKGCNSDTNAYSAIKDSGLPELSSLPNTTAGWGLAFLKIRESVGATNAILGMHVSGWAGNNDVIYGSINADIQTEVDKVYNFLNPLGLGSNITSKTYDFLVGDPLDRDADYYRVTQNLDRWLEPSDNAPINSKSFNRYAEWLRLWNLKSGKRWILWQVPLGNINNLNKPNNGNTLEGYKDNKVEYFLGANRDLHIEKFANSGVIGLLYGRGEQTQSLYSNDGDYMKKDALAFYQKTDGFNLK